MDIGDYVCVTGDRGVDIGRVIQRKPCFQRIASCMYSLAPSSQPLPVLLNKVSSIEISLLKDQVGIKSPLYSETRGELCSEAMHAKGEAAQDGHCDCRCGVSVRSEETDDLLL